MLSTSFNNELKILETKAIGIIKLSDLVNYYEDIATGNNFPKNLKALIDGRDCQMKVSPEEIRNTREAVKKATLNFKSISEALLMDKPYETAIASLFENYTADIVNYQFGIFLTRKAAVNWLLNR